MVGALANKSMTQLRSIAQGYGVADIFSMDENKLRQAIELRQQEMQPAPPINIPRPEYDARLMTTPPSKKSDQEAAMEVLKPYIARGLKVSFTPEQWFMSIGKKNDQGTLRMPLRHLIGCAERIMA